MSKDVIIACDFPSKEATLQFLDKFTGRKPYVKIGMELFYSEGPAIVREIKERGHQIFLDLKLHDIPNTVEKAMAALSKLDVDMCNLHAAGTKEMMEAALRGLTREDGTRPLLIAVTQLTSTSQERMQEELLINENLDKVVIKYAQNAKEAGLDGVVCSPSGSRQNPRNLRRRILNCNAGCPFCRCGQRRPGTHHHAGRREKIGSDYIVVGRPITKADDPVSAYEKMFKRIFRIEIAR